MTSERSEAQSMVRYPTITAPSRPAVVAFVAGAIIVVVVLLAFGALPIFVVGLALAYVVDPAVTGLERRGVPRWLASIALIVLLMLALIAFFAIVAGAVISQGAALVDQAPTAASEVQTWLATQPLPQPVRDVVDRSAADIGAALGSIDILGTVSGFIGSLFGILGVLLGAIGLPFYVYLILIDRPGLESELERRLPAPWKRDILAVLGIVVRQFGNYVRSEATLMVLLGGITWLGLMALSLLVDERIASFAIFLAVVAAFSELIPLFGPWIAIIPAIVFGLTLGPIPLVAIIALYIAISFFEGNVMVPAIEGRSFALRPALVPPILAIGLLLGGAFGAIIALPAASAARDVYRYVFRRATGVPPDVAASDGS